MDDKIDFLVYCIEEYKFFTKSSGKETLGVFRKNNVFDFILTNYNALHVTGSSYIVDDIKKLINAQQSKREA